jgi:hypothetical protein
LWKPVPPTSRRQTSALDGPLDKTDNQKETTSSSEASFCTLAKYLRSASETSLFALTQFLSTSRRLVAISVIVTYSSMTLFFIDTKDLSGRSRAHETLSAA